MADHERIVKGDVDMEDELLITPKRAAQLLGVGRTFVYAELLAKGRLESIKLGRRRLILRESLAAFIARERDRQAAENGGEAMSQGWPTSPERPKDSGTPTESF